MIRIILITHYFPELRYVHNMYIHIVFYTYVCTYILITHMAAIRIIMKPSASSRAAVAAPAVV